MTSFNVVCENKDCANNNKVINTISDIPEEDAEDFLESWSPDDDEEDACKLCGEAGVLQDSQ